MTDASERAAWISLSLLPGIGPALFSRLVGTHGSARAAWRAGTAALAGLPGLLDQPASMAHMARLHAVGAAAAADGVEQATRAADGRVVTALDAEYPQALIGLHPRPAVLYVRGSLAALDEVCAAVVGTRRPSGYGRVAAAEIGEELGRAGVTVVSGLAVGIDGIAQRAAIDAGGRSVAVLPSPLERVYPPGHRSLAGRLVETGGALLTEVPPGHPVGRPDFARRNRIIAGLSAATVVVEAPDRSGALLTAMAAVGYGRDLYAVPGPMDAANSRGTNRLIADHLAALLTSPGALLLQLGTRPATRAAFVRGLSEVESAVLARLLRRARSVEELAASAGLPTASVAGALTLLEARGLITAYGGATFHATPDARRLRLPG